MVFRTLLLLARNQTAHNRSQHSVSPGPNLFGGLVLDGMFDVNSVKTGTP